MLITYSIAPLAGNNASASVIRECLVNPWSEDNVKSLRRISTIAKVFTDGNRERDKRKAESGRVFIFCTDEIFGECRSHRYNENTNSISIIADELNLCRSKKSVRRITLSVIV